MATVEIHVVGNPKMLSARLHAISDSMYDFGDALEDAGQYWRDQVARQFALHGSTRGSQKFWKPLSPFTVAKKRGDFRPLIEHGSLESSYINPGDPQNVTEVSAMNARFGSAYRARNNAGNIKPVAKFHQEGTRDMAARPVAFGNRFLNRQITDAFVDHIFRTWPL